MPATNAGLTFLKSDTESRLAGWPIIREEDAGSLASDDYIRNSSSSASQVITNEGWGPSLTFVGRKPDRYLNSYESWVVLRPTVGANWDVAQRPNDRTFPIELAKKVVELSFREPEEDELGANRPSYESLRSALRFLLSFSQGDELALEDDLYCDRNGDIHIEWRKQSRTVEVVFTSGRENCFIYHSTPEDFGIETTLSHSNLYRRMRWLSRGV